MAACLVVTRIIGRRLCIDPQFVPSSSPLSAEAACPADWPPSRVLPASLQVLCCRVGASSQSDDGCSAADYRELAGISPCLLAIANLSPCQAWIQGLPAQRLA